MGSLNTPDLKKVKINNRIKSVCIIGAGPSGLASIKNILAANTNLDSESVLIGTVFEKSADVGGVWNYDEGLLETVLDNAMYSGLKSNLPKQMMRYIDFPSYHYGVEETYVSQRDVFNYLKKYATMNGLISSIKFNRMVTSVKPVFQVGLPEPVWHVNVQNTKNPSEQWNLEFDSVMICKGIQTKRKYSENAEQIINEFKGEILHSMDYNSPEKFRNQTVLLIGGGPSGRDLLMEISRTAKQVYLSLHDYDTELVSIPENKTNLEQIRRIQIAKNNSVVLEDGRELSCDVIIFCTGYEYDFPFLDGEIFDIKEGGKKITPLYLHMIHRKYPSLCVIGIGELNLVFLLADCQSKFYTQFLLGKIWLPTESQMTQAFNDEQSYRQKYGLNGSKSHMYHSLQWLYMRRLAIAGGFANKLEEFLPMIEKIYYTVLTRLLKNPFNFRNENFENILAESQNDVEDPLNINFEIEISSKLFSTLKLTE